MRVCSTTDMDFLWITVSMMMNKKEIEKRTK